KRPGSRGGGGTPPGPAEGPALPPRGAKKGSRPAPAPRLYVDAFAAEPTLADDLRQQHRFNAACAAVLAAAGKGEDAGKLGEKEKGKWRRQPPDRVRGDLAAGGKVVEEGPAQGPPVGQRDQSRRAHH